MADTSPIYVNGQTTTGVLSQRPALQHGAVAIVVLGRGTDS